MNRFKMKPFHFRFSFLIIIIIFTIVPLVKSVDSEHVEHSLNSKDSTHLEPVKIEHNVQTNDQDEFYMGVGNNPFWLKEQNFMLWLHIISMIISFGTLIPIGIVLGFANNKSKWYINTQIFGTIIVILGYFSGVMFNYSKSEDIYPSNFHSKFGWIILIIFLIQMIFGFFRFILNDKDKMIKFINISLSNESNDSLVDSSVDSSSASSHDVEAHDSLLYNSDKNDSSRKEYSQKQNKIRSKIIYNILSFVLIILIYSQFLLGFITLSDTCHGESFGNCLAHYVKGSIFFWFGLIAFVRYLGFFEDFGWEWNLLPISSFDKKNHKGNVSFSLLESIIIFLYGITNTFLEHNGKDKSWNHRDMQHASLAFMWWWAGLLGILLENKRLRKFLFSKSTISISNPIPSIIFIITAISISSHHQMTEFSLSIHKQFGGFLLLADNSQM
ncbi:hypothetical protein C1645_740552 [Glomus cerebriforme]|uniref:Cytochrome b561 domain-containing protein n=1 Tax=Glomus cerebriforme TaxID=658196 RepID=A0A397SKV1_9GLOM|nr:hypothetical protein C1645_740552 [Glomus cerebriforme]